MDGWIENELKEKRRILEAQTKSERTKAKES